ncbi:MAG TPA: GNAT family N-acetyltransferase [Sphingomicrobium sp.]
MIETERLILRGWRQSDHEPWAQMGRDPEVMRHFPALIDQDESDWMIRERLQPHIERNGWGLWAVERKSDRAFLGFTGLDYVDFACPIQGEVEIGWRLARHAWGRGYAFEAASAAAEYGFNTLGLERMVAMTVEANDRSRRLMDKLGMVRAPELDFDHPRVPEGSPQRPQIVYVLERPA